jgi:hypothetical protein
MAGRAALALAAGRPKYRPAVDLPLKGPAKLSHTNVEEDA